MSRPTREQIYAALFARVASVAGLVTTSRDLRHWADVPPAEQPALFQAQNDQARTSAGQPAGGRGVAPPSRLTLTADLHVYVHRATCAAPLLATAMNDLLDAIEARLAPDPGQMAQTLGGLVADCRVAGTITTDGGVLDDYGVAILPIELTCF